MGLRLGITVGSDDGNTDGASVGEADGDVEGTSVGDDDGTIETEGNSDGLADTNVGT